MKIFVVANVSDSVLFDSPPLWLYRSEFWVFTHFSFVCLFHLITKIVAAHFECFGLFVCFTPIFLLPTITIIIARDYFFQWFCLFVLLPLQLLSHRTIWVAAAFLAPLCLARAPGFQNGEQVDNMGWCGLICQYKIYVLHKHMIYTGCPKQSY